MVSINWKDGNFYVIMENDKIPRTYLIPSEQHQPTDIALDKATEITSLSRNWMKCELVNTYYWNDMINIDYKIVIPNDPNIDILSEYRWVNIKLVQPENKFLTESIEHSLRGIT